MRLTLVVIPALTEEAEALFTETIAQYFVIDPRQHHALVDARALQAAIEKVEATLGFGINCPDYRGNIFPHLAHRNFDTLDQERLIVRDTTHSLWTTPPAEIASTNCKNISAISKAKSHIYKKGWPIPKISSTKPAENCRKLMKMAFNTYHWTSYSTRQPRASKSHYKSYPVYPDSGVEWIGQTPEALAENTVQPGSLEL